MQSLQSEYNEIVNDRDALLLKLQRTEKDKEQIQRIQEDLSHMKLSLDSEHRSKQRLQEENERIKMDLSYWKDQSDGKQGLIRQFDSEKEMLERENKSMKTDRFVTLKKDLLEATVVKQTLETELKTTREPPALDASSVIFDGVRKPVTASQLLDCKVLDNLTFNQVVKGYKTVFEVSSNKKVNLKGTGPIAGVIIESFKNPGSSPGPLYKLTFTEAKKENLLPPDSIDLLLDAQAATGHIIDPRNNQKLTVEEACNQGVVDEEDRERLLAAEAAAIGYSAPGTNKPLSVFQAMKKGLIEKSTTLRLLQAQESVGGILDPILSVFLPRDVAIERKVVDDTICQALNQKPELYLDPESEEGVTYMAMKRRCKVEPHTGLLLLPIPEKVDPSKLVFDGVRKTVTAKQLLECGVLNKPTFKDLENGKKMVPEVSVDKKVNLKGTGPIAGVYVGNRGKMSFSEAKKQMLIPDESADLLLEAQAATGHIIDPKANQKLTVDEACARGVVDVMDQEQLLEAEAAAVGFKDPDKAKPITVFEATKKGIIDEKTGLRFLQAQESVGGILDPHLSVFLPKETAIRRNLIDKNLLRALNQSPEYYIDPESDEYVSYGTLKKRCKIESHTGLLLLPIAEKLDPSELIFDGVRKPVTGKQLLDCGVLDKTTFKQLLRGEKTVPEVSVDKKVNLKGTGPIAGILAGNPGKMSFTEAKKQMLLSDESADLLLEAQAATGHIIDPKNNQKLTVHEACVKGVVDTLDQERLLEAEAAAIGYNDPNNTKPVSIFGAIKNGIIDEKTGMRLLQAQDSVGGILDPHLSVFLPKETAVKRNLISKSLSRSLDKHPECYIDPESEENVSYEKLKKRLILKGTGPIAGIVMPHRGKMSFAEAKEQMMLPEEIADLLLEAQAATGHIIDPKNNDKLTVEEALMRGVVSIKDRDKFLEAEAAAVGYKDPSSAIPISVFEAIKKGIIDDKVGLRLLQAQESVGGVLDPNLSVFLPKECAVKQNLIDRKLSHALDQSPECYLDPETDECVSYGTLMKKCKMEPHTGLLFLPVSERQDPTKLIFDGVRKRVTAKELFDCGVLDKPTFNQLLKGDKTISEVSEDKKVSLKGTGSIAGLAVGPSGKMSFTEAKKQMFVDPEEAGLLLEAQAATGHIIDPVTNRKLTVDEACAKGVLDINDRDKLLAAEAAAVGYKDPRSAQPLSVFESAGGILDPNLSVFLPKDTAMKRNLLDEDLCRALKQNPECYIDPETEQDSSYGALKKKCKTEPHTGLKLLPISERKDPSKLIFEGVRKPVSAQQLLDWGVLDKPTFKQLLKGEKTIAEVSEDKKVSLKGTGSIAGLAVGPSGKMSFNEAKKQMLVDPDEVDLLLEAQAATGHIIDPVTNRKLTVDEACAKGVVDRGDQDKLLAAEAAAVGYKDPRSAQPLSVFEALKKGLLDKKTGIRLLQAQESAGGILDPNLSVFLPKDTAMKRNILDEDLCRALKQNPECYVDPETEQDSSYGALKKKCKTEPHTGLKLLPISERKDPSKLIFEGVRKPVSAQQLLDWGVLDKPTFKQLLKGEKTIAEVSEDKKVSLKGTGSIAGLAVGPSGKISFTEAKKQMLVDPDEVDLLLEAQAATGHIIDPVTNQKLSVDEACAKGVVDTSDRDKLLAAEAAAVGFKDPRSAQPLSVCEALKKGLLDKKTGIRLLQAQESAGGILDPNLSVFLPKDTAMKRNILDEDLCRALKQNPECYVDPETEQDSTYEALKKKCKTEPHTGLKLLPISERKNPSKLIFEGVRKPVSAQQLLDCGVLDKPTFNQLLKGEKTVPEVSEDKKVSLKGTGSIAGLAVGPSGKMSFNEAKKQKLLDPDKADLLLEAQAATGHIIDPVTNRKLTVDEACAKGVVDRGDRDKLLAAEAAAVGYKDPRSAQPLSVFEALKKGLLDKKTGIRLLQAQESAGGILDPNLSVFLPKDTAMKRNILDEDLCRALKQNPECYVDPETEQDSSYGALKKKCKTEPHTGLKLLPISERKDPSKLIFEGVRKPVSAQQLLDWGVLDKPTFKQLLKGEKTIAEVSEDKKVSLKGTGSIAGLAVGPSGKISFTEAKKQMLVDPDEVDLLLEAQAATGHIIDPVTNQKLSVDEACAKGVVDTSDRDKLLAAEAAAVGFKDPRSAQPLSVCEALKKGLLDKKTGIRFLQAQESAGGILDPNLSVFLPKDTAMKRNILDEDLCRALKQNPECYVDPETEQDSTYEALKKKCKTEPHTGLKLLPISERKNPSKLIFEGVRKPVSAQQLLDCGVLDKPTFNQLLKGEKTVPEVSEDKKVSLKGTGSIAGLAVGPSGKMSFNEAKKQKLLDPDKADLLLEAQAATGHIIDPVTNRKLTVDEACAKGVVDRGDRDKLLAAEAAAVGYKDPRSAQPLSVFEALKKGLLDKKTGIRLLQAQESAGGILDPNLSVFLPKDTAMKRNILDEDLCRALKQNPECYVDPETEQDSSYGALKKKCKTEPHTGLKLLPISERKDPSKLIFEGVRKPVSAQQLLDWEVSEDKKVSLKGTGSIAGLAVGPSGKMSFNEAKKQMLVDPDEVDLLLEAQAATGHIIDPVTNRKLTVDEACAKGVVDRNDRATLLAAEGAAVGFKDPRSAQPLSVFEAVKKGLLDKKTGIRLLQAQESAGGILDPNLSVFLPKDTAMKRNLLDEDLCRALKQNPECYVDPETEQDSTYEALKKKCKTEPHTGLKLLPISERKDPSKLIFEGVRKPVSAQQLLDCGVLDKPTFNQLLKGEKTVPEVSEDKKVSLKGTGSIAGLAVGPSGKMSFNEAKKQKLLDPDKADLLLEAQAATGHIIDPVTNRKLTVDEACAKGVVDRNDRATLLAAEGAAVGFKDPRSPQPLSVFEAVKKGLLDKKTGIRLLQAQESAGGILDPNLSVFLPKDTAMKRNLLDEDLCRALKQNPECYVDPETEQDSTYEALKKKCKTEPHTGLKLLPISERKDPSKLIFEGVRKPVSAQQLLDCGVLDKPTFNQLLKGEKTVPEVSEDKKVSLKGTGSIAGLAVGPSGKMSFNEAKKQMLVDPDEVDLLLEAQAATGHIIDPVTNRKLTVDEACANGVVDRNDRDKLLGAEAAAVGYKDRRSAQPLSVFEAIKKGLLDKKTGIRLLQAQESAGGILDPNLSVFLPKDTAMKRNLLDEDLCRALKQNPECYVDPETEQDSTYEALKKKCKTEPHTGLKLLPISERKDPSKLIFEGVRKPVSAQQLLDCGVLDKPTFNQLLKGEKTVPEVSEDKKVSLKGTGSIAGLAVGPSGKMSFNEAKKQMLVDPDEVDLLLEAQAATGHIIDPVTNRKLTVDEACAKGVVDRGDRDKLLAAEAAAVGYKDPRSAQPLSVFEAVKKGLLDKKTGIRLLQAQESVGGILDPNLSVFLPKDTAMKRNLLDEDLCLALKQNPECYVDPETEQDFSYEALKKKCKTEPHTGLKLLPISERKDPSKLIFEGVRKPVSAQQLLDCGVLDKPTFNQLLKGEKTIPEVSEDKKAFLKGTGPIAGLAVGPSGKMSFNEAKKQKLLDPDKADLLLEAQAATGHIIDPVTNRKLTVDEACAKGVVDINDRDKLLAAEAAAVGYKDPRSAQPLSVFEAVKKGLLDKKTGIRLLQAQESAGGILDPNLSVFLPKDTAMKRNLLDEDLCRALKQNPECYVDPETEQDSSYEALKKKCKTEPHTGLKLLPISERKDPSKLIFEGVRKPVSAQQLLDCGVLDKPTFNQLLKGEKTVPEVSEDKKAFLKGTGPIAGIESGTHGLMSLSEAKNTNRISANCIDLLLEAQAATGYIIDPKNNKKYTVEEACVKKLVDPKDQNKLMLAECAAIGYKDPTSTKSLSVFEAMKKRLLDKQTGLRLLQAQVSAGGILDPNLSVFLPKNVAIKFNLIDEDLLHVLNQQQAFYLDPDTKGDVSYMALLAKCNTNTKTGLHLLPAPDTFDHTELLFEGVRKNVTAQQLLDCAVLDKPTFDKLGKGEKTVSEVTVDKKQLHPYLRGSTCIAGVYDEASDKVLSIYEAMKNGLLRCGTSLELLEAQAASGFMVDPVHNLYLTVDEAYNRRVVGPEFKDKLLSAEKAVTGYKLPGTDNIISLFQAIEKGVIERGHGIRLLEAQIASGGIIDPEHSHRIDVNVAYKRGYFDEEMNKILTDESDDTKGFFDPNTEENLTYLDLKKRCIVDKKTGLILLPIIDKKKKESTTTNTRRKRRVIIVDPDTLKEMTVLEAFNKGYIDRETFIELSEQECEWDEITITDSNGSKRCVITDRTSGRKYDITEMLERRVIDESVVQQYHSRAITLTQFADIITEKAKHQSLSSSSTSHTPSATSTSFSKSLSTSASKGSTSAFTTSTSFRTSSPTPALLTSTPFSTSSPTSVSRTSAFVSTCSSTPTSETAMAFSASSPTSVSRTSTSLSTSSSSSVSATSSSTSTVSRETEASFSGSSTSNSSFSKVGSTSLSPPFTKTVTTRTTTVMEQNPIGNVQQSPDSLKRVSSVSFTLSTPFESVGDLEPVSAVFDTDTVEKISIMEALNRGIVDSITAQRLLEAQACTGGIVDPTNGKRLSIQEACRIGLIDGTMELRLKPAQKAFFGFKDVKTKKMMSIAEAVKERWLPYESGQRFLEFQVVTGGLYDPEMGCRRSIEDALKMGWLDERAAQKLHDIKSLPKCLTCPKTKLKISYKEALDNCLVEEGTGVKMLPASSMSSKGISSPYNAASAPGSTTGSRSGSQRSSRRGSLDLGPFGVRGYTSSSSTSFLSK
uniref:Desmoplakin b n=1 Tax=Oryzias latipes TaxID=8090 RepID=A0A3P9IQI4_ORYLA